MIKNILVVNYTENNGSGGDIHIRKMTDLWGKMDIKIIKFYEKSNYFNFLDIIFPLIIFKKKSLFKIIDDFDIIISSSPYYFDFIPTVMLYLKYRKPTVIYFHHLPPHFYWKTLKRGFLSSILNSIYFSVPIVLSKILRFTFFLDQPTVYNLGSAIKMKIDGALEKDFMNSIDSSSIDEQEFNIGYFGRFQSSKGIIDLINALPNVILKFPELKVVLAGQKGNEKYNEKLFKRIKKLNLENNIKIFYDVDFKTKIRLLKSMKVYVFPSYVEGWALSVMEAAYVGIPIIAYDLPAYSYLDGNYFAVKIGNVKELSEKIIYVLSNYEKTKDIAQKAHEKVSLYDYEKIAKDQIDFFNEMLKKK